MLLIIILVVLFVLAAISVIRSGGRSKRANQTLFDAMTPEQQGRVFAAQAARRRQKLLFAAFCAVIVMFFVWLRPSAPVSVSVSTPAEPAA
jgi:hypothetical protein